MCEVCAAFGRNRHWTSSASEDPEVLESSDLNSYRTERREILSILNAMFSKFEVYIEDWDGESYQINLASGVSMIAPNLTELWILISKSNSNMPRFLEGKF